MALSGKIEDSRRRVANSENSGREWIFSLSASYTFTVLYFCLYIFSYFVLYTVSQTLNSQVLRFFRYYRDIITNSLRIFFFQSIVNGKLSN